MRQGSTTTCKAEHVSLTCVLQIVKLNVEEIVTCCAEEEVVDVRVRGGASSPTAVH
jgi:hypothetical protein